MELNISPGASRLLAGISRFLDEKGIPSYIVGGFVRDMLLERETADIDIAVAGNALEAAGGVAAALGGRYVPLDEAGEVGRVVLPDSGWQVDFTTLKNEIEHDLAQRDFTVDAMAVELEKAAGGDIGPDDIIDPFGGETDLRSRVIRAVSEDIFAADAARLVRAVRLAAELDFSIDGATEELIARHSRLVTGVSGERVREELLRLLAPPGAGHRLAYLDRLGLLTALIPELAPAKGVTQPTVHVWDVFDHSLETVKATEFVLREADWEPAGREVLSAVPWSAELEAHFDRAVGHGSTRRSLLKLAALLHDVAKPGTRTLDEDGRARFIGHPQEGAETAAAVLERLRFSTREIKLVELMVRYHLRPLQMSHEELPSRRAIYRYFRDTGDAGIDIMYLCLADHLATRAAGLDPAQWRYHTHMTEYVLEKQREEEGLIQPAKLVDGHDLMNIFGLEAGPDLGKILEALRETQAAGEVNTREEALDYIKNLLAGRAKAPRNEATREEK